MMKRGARRGGLRGWLVAATLPLALARAVSADGTSGAGAAAPVYAFEGVDGTAGQPAMTRARFDQIGLDLNRSGFAVNVPNPRAWRATAESQALRGAVPVAFFDYRLAAALPGRDAAAPPQTRVFAAVALRDWTYRGEDVAFWFDRRFFGTDQAAAPPVLQADFGDGHGFRAVHWGERLHVHYSRTGPVTVRVRAAGGMAPAADAAFAFDVRALATPLPDDTLHVTASIPYLGVAGHGEAYIALAPGHTTLVNPVVVIEGFDLDNVMHWDELYQLLSGAGLLDALQAQGFDAVVIDFADATDYIQRNAFVVTEVLAQVQAIIPPSADVAVVGASMGGLVGRYALAYLEAQSMVPRVRTFISFDAPQRGANIPLGVQYWVQFFADLSADAAALRDVLNSPAARQMLVYHFTIPPSATPSADPLRAQLLADLDAVGSYPAHPRLVAIANGSGAQAGQGFAPGAQVVRYEYTSFLVDVTGNVWAVPNGGSATIFRGIVDYLFPPPESQSTVTVSGTAPYDNAPGGWRSSMADMDATAAPFGDIIALYPNHCFIPTISALDVNTTNLFEPILGAPGLLARTPFDAVYAPAANQQHVSLTAENTAWFLAEIPPAPSDVNSAGPSAPRTLVLHPAVPNPFNPSTHIEFDVPWNGRVVLAIHDMRGRRVATLVRGELLAGHHAVQWNGRTDRGARAASGVYLCTLQGPGGETSRRIVLAK